MLPIFAILLAVASPSWAAAPAVGALMPRFELPARAGAVDSDSLRGHTVYVDFWASWCVPCRRSFPWLRELQERYGEHGLAIVAINLDKDRAAADRFLAAYPSPFRVAFDPTGKTAGAFHVSAMPSSFLIDREGRLIEAHAGFDPKQAAAIEARIRKECTP
ncbi:MAG: TlpA disulfide reductase family protein [Candidatus Eisenbacteria bacterium]